MARPKRQDALVLDAGGEESAPAREPVKRIKVTAYKIHVPKYGRLIAGQYAELPESVADDLIAQGLAQ